MGSQSEVAPNGLRERKKRRTRETIARVALELFAEQGFHDTTIRQIAEVADVSPRTVSAYFPVKEELVFGDHEAAFDSLEARLRDRRPGETAAEAMREWIVGEVLSEHSLGDLDRSRCLRSVIESDPTLRTYERGLQERAERIIAEAVAVDLDLPPDDLVPTMVGAATMAALDALGRGKRLPADADLERFRSAALQLIDQAMAFVGAGVRGLQARQERSA